MSIDAMKQALEALDEAVREWRVEMEFRSCIDVAKPWAEAAAFLRAAIEQADKPLGWRWKERINGELDNWVVTFSEPPPYAIEQQPLYTTPRQWQGLTDEERGQVINANFATGLWQMAKDIEAKLKEKNT